MAEYLFDTNHLTYTQERHPQVLARLRRLPADTRVTTSVVGVAELLTGVHRLPESRRRDELMDLYRQMIGDMAEILPITLTVAERFAEIEASLRKKGRPIPTNDVWVAALAIERGAVLVTNDAHFAEVDGLAVEDWTR